MQECSKSGDIEAMKTKIEYLEKQVHEIKPKLDRLEKTMIFIAFVSVTNHKAFLSILKLFG